ncbi:Acetylornithine deacetylase/Succinyl-diaminopimelate desuccinylase [Meinhardsimonia xiamenensis]|jgi:acetylornithine deacetylase/succinyl-diaminopimelate desuccinylase-like protein|uniref:Acetylornithine deacetylase/Succinyl-diaminopimelate desuccinylase n=1 Tax=Meinhardsimonia xiamenensis TaxID=990712 RepID=A0A1G9CZ51_9RHOB|nr:M20/M25/M40 family metallo-hydrolase [Meinhardsimonia xiamenensis]PRX38191.1 acetylornithine deacetylase/succinyl-diaminopimelate desuccinylase-like protein [Meinhardsimonia xiamenensis]SDK56909.1 Acetylornithine deacetylase/Succinyl-diaminopimelate desuccinylase [Meinhardsimonia xiamenensis]
MNDASPLYPVLERIDANLDAALERLMDLLRIPSISTDPAHAEDCRRAAEWLVADLESFGVAASARATPGHPMVVGHGGEGPRRLVFYGHYDVQPVDPIELWHRDPFDPAIEETPEGKVIRARGASDDKGQLMTFVEAARAWVEVHGALPAAVTFHFEGEEESGSPSLVPFLEANADELRGDLALICDTGLFDNDTPAITTMLRGLLGEEVTISAADRDLHSGMYGGIARNPIHVLSRIIAALHDDEGRITVPGFYEGVSELPAAIREQWQALGFDARKFLGAVGLSEPAGERDRMPLEMIWSRPSCDVNGISGGYEGPGFKTVLPARASAKLSFRLVGEQDPHKIRRNFRAMVQGMLPADCTAEFADHGASPACQMPADDPAFEAARRALGAEWPKPAAFIGCGGSIPIAGYFQSILGMNSLLIGFGRDDDNIHSPNEKYHLSSFHRGARSWARVLHALSMEPR